MIKKIRIEDLQSGMLVCGLGKTEGDASFFTNNVRIKDSGDIQRLRDNGFTEAYVDTDLAGFTVHEPVDALEEQAPPGAGLSEDPGASPFSGQAIDAESLSKAVGSLPLENTGKDINPAGFETELEAARRIKAAAVKALEDVMQDVRLGKSIDRDLVDYTVNGIMGSILRNIYAISSLARLKSYDKYTFTHSINVCILCVALGRHMGLNRDSLYCLGVGAMLHDIGKMLMPQELINKRGAYNPEEFRIVQEHPVKGAEIIIGLDWVGEGAVNAVSEHHERYDGGGYPLKLGGEDIHRFARITGLCDMYDAMTTDRVYRKLPADRGAEDTLYAKTQILRPRAYGVFHKVPWHLPHRKPCRA